MLRSEIRKLNSKELLKFRVKFVFVSKFVWKKLNAVKVAGVPLVQNNINYKYSKIKNTCKFLERYLFLGTLIIRIIYSKIQGLFCTESNIVDFAFSDFFRNLQKTLKNAYSSRIHPIPPLEDPPEGPRPHRLDVL